MLIAQLPLDLQALLITFDGVLPAALVLISDSQIAERPTFSRQSIYTTIVQKFSDNL